VGVSGSMTVTGQRNYSWLSLKVVYLFTVRTLLRHRCSFYAASSRPHRPEKAMAPTVTTVVVADVEHSFARH
jgi:hypothetical protein